MSPKNTKVIPRGGTGATDDSFLSSQKQQQYSANYGNPSGYSQMGLTANSFHQVADTSANSFDLAAQNPHNGGPASFSNTATDWNAAHRTFYLELGADHVSDTRSTKWTNEYQKREPSYSREDNSSMQMRTTHSFLNQKQLDRREDDE